MLGQLKICLTLFVDGIHQISFFLLTVMAHVTKITFIMIAFSSWLHHFNASYFLWGPSLFYMYMREAYIHMCTEAWVWCWISSSITFYIFFFGFQNRFFCVALVVLELILSLDQTSLKLREIQQLLSPQCWDSRCAPPVFSCFLILLVLSLEFTATVRLAAQEIPEVPMSSSLQTGITGMQSHNSF